MTYDELLTQLRREFPSFRIRNKSEVWWWIWLYRLSLARFWQPSMLTSMWVTLGYRVYRTPSHVSPALESINDFVTLWHERQHMVDFAALQARVGGPLGALLWYGGYAFPQVLALGAVGAFWTPWAWLCLLALAPWPAPFRVWVEKRGYAATLEGWAIQRMLVSEVGIVSMVKRVFYGWDYYRMAWSGEDKLIRWFLDEYVRLSRREIRQPSHRV